MFFGITERKKIETFYYKFSNAPGSHLSEPGG